MEHSDVFGFAFSFSYEKHDIIISEVDFVYKNGIYYNKEFDISVPGIGFWEVNKQNEYRLKEDMLLDLDNFDYIFICDSLELHDIFSSAFLMGVVANQYKVDKITGLN